jgi:hypothetical protein
MLSNAHEKEVTLTVRKAAYITHFLKKMKGQTLNNSPLERGEINLSATRKGINHYISYD